jgi:hypothetical protein
MTKYSAQIKERRDTPTINPSAAHQYISMTIPTINTLNRIQAIVRLDMKKVLRNHEVIFIMASLYNPSTGLDKRNLYSYPQIDGYP